MILDEKRTISYWKKIATVDSPDKIEQTVKAEFEPYGSEIDVAVSKPQKVIAAGTDGKQSYQVDVSIKVEQRDFAEVEKYANKAGWKKPVGIGR
jgi:hypothetical protein